MLSMISNVLAPPLPLHEEFIWHWNSVTHHYSDTKRDQMMKGPVESTSIVSHLQEMNRILMEEEHNESRHENESQGSIGSCLEYLLQHKMLDTMSVLAQSDAPPGMCQQVLLFITRLLSYSNMNLIPNGSVYNPIHKLILLCGKMAAGPYERSEVEFLSVLCRKICENQDLVNCFLRDSFPLINALLALLQSPDTEISTRAGDAIIKLVSVINERVANIVTKDTPFCSKIVHQLVSLYHEIPRSLKPEEIDSAINNCFRPNESSPNSSPNCSPIDSSPSKNLTLLSPAIRRFLCFLRWFVFFDMIIHHAANKVLTEALLMQFNSEFLDSCIVPDLTGSGYKDAADAEDHILLTTVLLANCLRNIESDLLASNIGEYLLMDPKSDPQTETSFSFNIKKHPLKSALISRCLLVDPKLLVDPNRLVDPKATELSDNKRVELCMATMQLFEEILNKPSSAILETLVIKYLSNRGYYDNLSSDSDTNFDFNEFEEQKTLMFPLMIEDSGEVSPGSSPSNHYFTASRIHRILYYFTSLVPDELKSCNPAEEMGMGYETYVKEAQRHFQDCALICENWNWPQDPIVTNAEFIPSEDENGSTSSQPEAEADVPHKLFYEGPFLSMIFDNLEFMMRLPYEVNLQVTSLISKLALFPHPNLHEYLLDPTISLSRGTRTLFGVLHRVVDELQIRVQGMGNLKEKLINTRKKLLGETDLNSCQVISQESENTIEALIVIEEFCKELAAVSFVKHHITV